MAQKFNELTYLEINPICERFNSAFWDTNDCELTSEHYKWFAQNGFGNYSEQVSLQPFSNQTLEMDFLPEIKGYFIMDKEGNHYMLVRFAKYNSQEFTPLKLLKYTSPYFSFPMQTNYIND